MTKKIGKHLKIILITKLEMCCNDANPIMLSKYLFHCPVNPQQQTLKNENKKDVGEQTQR